MNTRRLAAAALVAILPVAAIACGDDAKGATTTTTTKKTEKKSGSSTTSTSADGAAPATISFNEGIAQLQAELDAAEGDICKLQNLGSSQGDIADPATKDEVQAAGEFTADYLNAIADATPADGSQKAEADTIHAAAEAIPAQLEAANYDPKLVTGGNSIISGNKELIAALTTVQTSAQATCGGSTTTTP